MINVPKLLGWIFISNALSSIAQAALPETFVQEGSGYVISVEIFGGCVFCCDNANKPNGNDYVLNETVSSMNFRLTANASSFSEVYYRTVSQWGPITVGSGTSGPFETNGEPIDVTTTYTYQQGDLYSTKFTLEVLLENEFGNETELLAQQSFVSLVLIEEDFCQSPYSTPAPTSSFAPSMAPSTTDEETSGSSRNNKHFAVGLVAIVVVMVASIV